MGLFAWLRRDHVSRRSADSTSATIIEVTALAPATPTATVTYLVADSQTYQLVAPITAITATTPLLSPSSAAIAVANPKNPLNPKAKAEVSTSSSMGDVFGGGGNGITKVVITPVIPSATPVEVVTVTVTHTSQDAVVSATSLPGTTEISSNIDSGNQASSGSNDGSIFIPGNGQTAVVITHSQISSQALPSPTISSSNDQIFSTGNGVTAVILPSSASSPSQESVDSSLSSVALASSSSAASLSSSASLASSRSSAGATPITNPKASSSTPLVSPTSTTSVISSTSTSTTPSTLSSTSRSTPVPSFLPPSTSTGTDLGGVGIVGGSSSGTSLPTSNPSSSSSSTTSAPSSAASNDASGGFFTRIGRSPAAIGLAVLVGLGILAVLLGIAACLYRRYSPRRRREKDDRRNAVLITEEDEEDALYDEDTLERHERGASMGGWRDPFRDPEYDDDAITTDSAAAVLPVNVWARRNLGNQTTAMPVDRSPKEMSEYRPSSDWTSMVGDQAVDTDDDYVSARQQQPRMSSIVAPPPAMLAVRRQQPPPSRLNISQIYPTSPTYDARYASPSPPVPNLRLASVRADYGRYLHPPVPYIQDTQSARGKLHDTMARWDAENINQGNIYNAIDSQSDRYGSTNSLNVAAGDLSPRSPIYPILPSAPLHFPDPPVAPIRPLFSPTPSMPPRASISKRRPSLQIVPPPRPLTASPVRSQYSSDYTDLEHVDDWDDGVAESDAGSSTVGQPSPARTVRPTRRSYPSHVPRVPPTPLALQVTPNSPIRHAFAASRPASRPGLVHLNTASTIGGLSTISTEEDSAPVAVEEEAGDAANSIDSGEERRIRQVMKRKESEASTRLLMLDRRRRSDGETITRRGSGFSAKV